MAGLGLFLYGAVKAAFGIGKAIDNQQMKNYTYKIDNQGRPTWMDRNCNEYINGEKVIAKAVTRSDGSVKLQQVGQRSGSVYFDPDVARNNKIDSINNKQIQQAKEWGKLAYPKYDPKAKREITCEISTGKYISCLKGLEDGTYWKYYLPANYTYYSDRDENAGIQITQDEYDKLNIFNGSHYASDLNRYTYDAKCKLVMRRKPLVAKEDLPKVPV